MMLLLMHEANSILFISALLFTSKYTILRYFRPTTLGILRNATDCHEVVEYEMYSCVMLELSPQPL